MKIMENNLSQLLTVLNGNCENITRLIGSHTNVGGYGVKPIIKSIGRDIKVTFRLEYLDDCQYIRNTSPIFRTYSLENNSLVLRTTHSSDKPLCFSEKVGFFNRSFLNISEEQLLSSLMNMLNGLIDKIEDVKRFNDKLVTDQYLGNITSLKTLSKLSEGLNTLSGMNLKLDSKMQLTSLESKHIKVFPHDYDDNHLCFRIENEIAHQWGIAHSSILIAINRNGRYFEVYQNDRNNIIDKSKPYLDYSFVNDLYFCIAYTPENHKVDLNNTAIEFGHIHHFELSPDVSKYFQSNHTRVDGYRLESDEIKSLIESSILALS